MKLLLDQGLPRSAAELLRQAGLEAVHVGEVNMSRAEDTAILQKGREESFVVITLDADFHTLLALSGATTPSVIRIRIEGLKGDALATLIQTVLAQANDELVHGAALTVQEGRIRIRRLPILGPAAGAKIAIPPS